MSLTRRNRSHTLHQVQMNWRRQRQGGEAANLKPVHAQEQSGGAPSRKEIQRVNLAALTSGNRKNQVRVTSGIGARQPVVQVQQQTARMAYSAQNWASKKEGESPPPVFLWSASSEGKTTGLVGPSVPAHPRNPAKIKAAAQRHIAERLFHL